MILESLQALLAPWLGLILLGGVFLLLALKVPIGVSLGLPSILVSLIAHGKISGLATAVIGAMNEKFLLTAIPFFVLSSVFLTSGGAAKRIVQFAVTALGHLRGGMGIAGVFACMMFAALSGSSPATVAAIGPIAIAGMAAAGYPKRLGAGIISTAGTLGILIPPSIVMVVYAAATNESVGKMFLAGIIPGLLAGLILMIGIRFSIGKHQVQSQNWPGWKAFWRDGYHAVFGLMLIVLILAGIYAGWFTPTEAAATAAVYGLVVSTAIYRGIGPMKEEPWRKPHETIPAMIWRNGWKIALLLPVSLVHSDVRAVLLEAAKISAMLMFIIFNALIFSHTLTELQIPLAISELVTDQNMAPWLFLIILNLLLLIGGQFMEPSGLLLIVAPVMHPIALELGIDPIHLGIIMVVNMEIGMITPPVGLNLFVTSSITKMSVLEVMRAALPWTGLLFLFLLAVTYIPAISLFLPNLLWS